MSYLAICNGQELNVTLKEYVKYLTYKKQENTEIREGVQVSGKIAEMRRIKYKRKLFLIG